MTARHPFDALARDYDADFTTGVIGRCMRRAVHRRLEEAFGPGDRVLDLGCGTGEDAVWLARRGIAIVAVDRSAEMVAAARAKVERAGVGERIGVRQAAIEDVFGELPAASFDGALSNFGALNCVADLGTVAAGLAAVLRPGAPAVLCVMGPWVPWEWLWYLVRGRPGTAFRRLRPGGAEWRGMTVRYPSIGGLKRVFQPAFEVRRLSAVGALLPPSYAEGWAARNPRWIERLDRWERHFETRWPLPWLADHYLIELQLASGCPSVR